MSVLKLYRTSWSWGVKNFIDFCSPNSDFWCIVGVFLRFSGLFWTQTAGLFHFRCDASLITEYRPYTLPPLVLNCDFDPMCNITVQGRLTPHYGWEINPPHLTWWSTIHLIWAEHGGMILLFGPAWFGYFNAVIRISTILSYVLFI